MITVGAQMMPAVSCAYDVGLVVLCGSLVSKDHIVPRKAESSGPSLFL